MAFWWVNQNATWRHEIFGEYLWSPQLDAKKRHSHFYDNMTLLNQGDIVFSHFEGALRYVGIVVNPALPSRKPNFGFAGGYWSDDGWSVEMRFLEIVNPIKPQDHLDLYLQVAPDRYGPMNPQGRVNQQYLFGLPLTLGAYYLNLAGLTELEARNAVNFNESAELLVEEAEEVLNNPNLTTTEKHVLARARIGQGIFKDNVRRIEPSCRITGLSEDNYLIASHVKPWRDSNNQERLDGNNGLLLSPHVDFLFDRGMLTFENSGEVRASLSLSAAVPELWRLDMSRRGKRFRSEQIPYMEYHRDVVFNSR
jgi:hypothetical protein